MILPWKRIMSIGAQVRYKDSVKLKMDGKLAPGRGGKVRGDVAENGMNDLALGSNRDAGMRFSC